MLKRSDLLTDILREAGIPSAKHKQYLTKTELMQLLLQIKRIKRSKEIKVSTKR